MVEEGEGVTLANLIITCMFAASASRGTFLLNKLYSLFFSVSSFMETFLR